MNDSHGRLEVIERSEPTEAQMLRVVLNDHVQTMGFAKIVALIADIASERAAKILDTGGMTIDFDTAAFFSRKLTKAVESYDNQFGTQSQRLHTKDSDCIVSDETGCCVLCGVAHTDPCPTCGGKAFHVDGCEVAR